MVIVNMKKTCEYKNCKNGASSNDVNKSIGLTGHIFCPVHLERRLRINVVMETILHYVKNGQSINDVLETTRVTQEECMEALSLIQKAIKNK